jgi:hypothetical protein
LRASPIGERSVELTGALIGEFLGESFINVHPKARLYAELAIVALEEQF